jgi:hypothetical protein
MRGCLSWWWFLKRANQSFRLRLAPAFGRVEASATLAVYGTAEAVPLQRFCCAPQGPARTAGGFAVAGRVRGYPPFSEIGCKWLKIIQLDAKVWPGQCGIWRKRLHSKGFGAKCPYRISCRERTLAEDEVGLILFWGLYLL